MTNHEDFPSNEEEDRQQLNEPAPRPRITDGRFAVHDGLDNSDLRLALELASKEANKEE